MVACALYVWPWTDIPFFSRNSEIPFLYMGISLNSKHRWSSASIRAYCRQQKLHFALEKFLLPCKVPLSWPTPAACPRRATPFTEHSAGWSWDKGSAQKSAARNLPQTELLLGVFPRGSNRQSSQNTTSEGKKHSRLKVIPDQLRVFWVQPLPESRLISLSKQAGLSSLNLHAAEAPVTRGLGFP